MIIQTKRLLLRPLKISDINTVHEYASDLENTKYMMFLPNTSLKETLNFLEGVEREWKKEDPSTFEFAIILDDIHIGAVSISLNKSNETGEIGWILNKKYWNCGYVTEAAKAVLDFAKNKLKLKKVIAQCDFRNTPSFKVMEKLGMKLIDENGIRSYLKRKETAKELTYMIEF